MTLRVGTVPYLVGRPLDLGLAGEPDVQLITDVPAELVSGLRTERLDVALVSSIEMFRQPGYSYLAGAGVCAAGPVSSVQVFTRKPIDRIETLALDPASRTAATLVQILLGATGDGGPQYLEVPLGKDPRTADTDAWLRIGDKALQEKLERSDEFSAWDPCEEWTRRTGMPFVFAAWVVRANADVRPYFDAFVRARKRGAAAIPALARRAAEELELPGDYVLKYLRDEIVYEPGAQMETALERFASAARSLGLASGFAQPAAIQVPGFVGASS